MNPAEHAVPLPPVPRDFQSRNVARDVLSFVGLAMVVALGTAVVLSTLVLLLAGPADATPGGNSTPASRPLPQSAAPTTAQCIPHVRVTGYFEAAESPERCRYLMRIPNVPETKPAPALLRARAPDAARRGRA